MTDYSKITALYSRLSVGDEDRDGGESNSIQNQKIFLENYARGQHLTNIRHYIDDDESGRFFDRSAYSRMMDDVENGKIGVCIMKDLTRWGRDYLQVGNAMEIFRRNNVRFIAVNNGIDSEKPDTLEFAPFINIMSEWYAKDISKKVKTGIKTKGMSGKPIVTEAPYQNQMRVYTEMIAANKEWEFAGLYADEGISGTRADKRPEFQRMIRDCQNGKIDYIITKSVSRFARNTVECLEYVRSLKAQGIGIFFEEQNIDTLKNESELYLVIYAGFAQSESESISKHITWTYRKKFEEGKVSFQYKNFLGYRKGEDIVGKRAIVEAAIL